MKINEDNAVAKTTLKIAIGQALCILIMFGIFAICRRFTYKVLLGGVLGGIVTILNFFFMGLSIDGAADRYGESEKNIKASVQLSFIARLLVMLVCLGLALKSRWFDPIALLVPLCLVRPILLVCEFFTRSKSNDKEINEEHDKESNKEQGDGIEDVVSCKRER